MIGGLLKSLTENTTLEAVQRDFAASKETPRPQAEEPVEEYIPMPGREARAADAFRAARQYQ